MARGARPLRAAGRLALGRCAGVLTLVLALGPVGCAEAQQSRLEAHGPPAPAALSAASPRAACLDAVRAAERSHNLPEGLLVAVALNESGLHAYALNIGGRAHFPSNLAAAQALYRAGLARGSVMAGCVQVNAGVHARRADWPLDPHAAADWGARYLRQAYDRSGSWTEALRRWHGGSPAGTARLICRVRSKLEVTAPGSDILAGARCGDTARVRRNGVTLLELAEAAER
jgi:hypothetical protein